LITLFFVLLALVGCGESGDFVPIPGTTARIGTPTTAAQGNNTLQLYIFRDESDCAPVVKENDLEACLPFIDRATGQVRLSFQMRVAGSEWKVPLSKDNIQVFHKNQQVIEEGRKRFDLVPHDPSRGEQLFILLIDGSGSMAISDANNGRTRMDKLKDALLRKDVVDSFFPGDVKTAVAPFVFRGGMPEQLGPNPIIWDKKEYREVIRDRLQVGSGFTFFYRAVDWATTTLLQQEYMKQAVQVGSMSPTIISLTDGFNNEAPADTCADNAPRLQTLLASLDKIRRGEGDVRYLPTVYTVGLGRSAWRQFEVPDDTRVSPSQLCKGYTQEIVNGGVERRGVDNAALSWIARIGGGSSFISRTTNGLADAFKAAAAVRYRWFEARYQVDPFYLRRSFVSKLRLTTLMSSEASIEIKPSGWIDGPPGTLDADGWAHRSTYRQTLTLLLPLLGLFAASGYFPAAWFNVRRALFSRVARKKKKR
jgi:hypothetical protein